MEMSLSGSRNRRTFFLWIRERHTPTPIIRKYFQRILRKDRWWNQPDEVGESLVKSPGAWWEFGGSVAARTGTKICSCQGRRIQVNHSLTKRDIKTFWPLGILVMSNRRCTFLSHFLFNETVSWIFFISWQTLGSNRLSASWLSKISMYDP